MAEQKDYVDTDALRADDEMSPKPASDKQPTDGSKEKGDETAQQVPRPATSE